MGSVYAKDVIHGAQAWIGYHEGDNNWNTFAKILDGCNYFDPQYKQNIPWCAIFCDCMCLLEALPKDRDDEAKKYDAQYVLYQPSYNNYSAGAREFAGYFKAVGEWYTSDPKIGDMIFFDFGNGIAHVGIVEDVDGCITTIEGNAGDMVQRKWYDFDDSRIAGFGRPRYDEDGGSDSEPTPDPEPTPEPTPDPEPTTQEFTVQTYSGDALRLRAEPTTDSEQVGWIDNGTTFEADKIVEGEWVGGINTWVYYNGGYASGRYLFPTPEIIETPAPEPTPTPEPEPEPVGKEYTVSVDSWLNVRHGPGTEYEVVAKLLDGDTVTVYEEQDGWGRISNDMDIWVSMDYLN